MPINRLTAICVFAVLATASPAAETVLHEFGGLLGMNPRAGLTADTAGNLYGTASGGGATDLGVVFKLDARRQETVLHHFTGGADGAVPYAGVIRDAEGNLYGTTYQGGTANVGVVYKLDPNGRETVRYTFTGGADGANPQAGLILDDAGNLYGTASKGGGADAGVVFKLDAAGHQTVLYSFTGGADGKQPYAGVIRDAAGNLYGTTFYGGITGYGVVYKLDSSGQETVLYSFTAGDDGGLPATGLVRGPEGTLFGTATVGGRGGGGVVFRLDTTGNETVLRSFPLWYYQSASPNGLILDPAGNLYGTIEEGGENGVGCVFKLDATGHYTDLYDFPYSIAGSPGGVFPRSGVIRDPAGNLYGTTFLGGPGFGSVYHGNNGVVYKLDTAGKETVLCTFTNKDGLNPSGGVIRDAVGNFYGTASYGGGFGQGIVFKIDAKGRYTVLHSFTGGEGGGQPYSGVIRDPAGNLYGTAGQYFHKGGVVFKLDAAGRYTVLHRFVDGAFPSSGVILDPAGNLYGTTNSAACDRGSTVYKLDTAGHVTVLYRFTGGADGCYPLGGLIRDPAGNLYGTASAAGGLSGGLVFKLDAAGGMTVLYNFTGGADGSSPESGLVRDSAGNLYGTTYDGGVVYKLDATGHLTVLHRLQDGGLAVEPSGVVRDSAGNLYGTTRYGGQGAGIVYKLDAAGQLTVLQTFSWGAGGGYPSSGVILDPAGNLYGTTSAGGKGGNGVVFKLQLD